MKLDAYNAALSGHVRCGFEVGTYHLFSTKASTCLEKLRDLIAFPHPDHAALLLRLFAAESPDMKIFAVNCSTVDYLFISRALNAIYMLMSSKFTALTPPSSLSWRLLYPSRHSHLPSDA